MKAYQFKYQEILINKLDLPEERLLEEYNTMLQEILLIRNISSKRIFEAINMVNGNVSSKPFITEILLRSRTLPVFCFLICAN